MTTSRHVTTAMLAMTAGLAAPSSCRSQAPSTSPRRRTRLTPNTSATTRRRSPGTAPTSRRWLQPVGQYANTGITLVSGALSGGTGRPPSACPTANLRGYSGLDVSAAGVAAAWDGGVAAGRHSAVRRCRQPGLAEVAAAATASALTPASLASTPALAGPRSARAVAPCRTTPPAPTSTRRQTA